jgi:hypothetical protein
VIYESFLLDELLFYSLISFNIMEAETRNSHSQIENVFFDMLDKIDISVTSSDFVSYMHR